MFISSATSLTNDFLVPKIYKLGNDSTNNIQGFVKRQILTRLLACATFIFRSADFFINIGTAFSSIFYEMRKEGFKQFFKCKSQNFSYLSEQVTVYFQGAKEAITYDPFQMFKLIYHPKNYIEDSHPDLDSVLDIDRESIAKNNLTLGKYSDNNWNLSQYFGHIYVLNLDDTVTSNGKYAKRLENIAKDLNKIGIQRHQFERFRAIYGAKELDAKIWDKIDDNSFRKSGEELRQVHQGQAGNYISHYRIIFDAYTNYTAAIKEFKKVKKEYRAAVLTSQKCAIKERLFEAVKKVKKYSSIVIIEDDNGFGFLNKPSSQDKAKVILNGTGKYFQQVMQELPKDWHLFYFMAEHGRPINLVPYTESLNRLYYGVCLNAYAINYTAYKSVLAALGKIYEEGVKVRPTDHVIASLHRTHKVFVPKNPVAYQDAGQSSISGGSGEEPWNGTWSRDF